MAAAALSKALNGLSWEPRIVVPEAIDAERTVFAVDLRALGWDASTWRRLLRAYPYGVSYEGSDDPTLAAAADRLVALAGPDPPALRADWFVWPPRPGRTSTTNCSACPSRPRSWRADSASTSPADLRHRRVMRTAVADSRKSPQNRVMDRHESDYGAYWRAYGFYSERGRRRPLRPAARPDRRRVRRRGAGLRPRLRRHALRPAQRPARLDDRRRPGPADPGGADGDRRRLAPTSSGSPAAVNALSCIACHRLGIIPFEDDLRGRLRRRGRGQRRGAAADPDARGAGRAARGRPAPLPRRPAAGRRAVPAGRRRPPTRSIESQPEPIRFVARRQADGLTARTPPPPSWASSPARSSRRLAGPRACSGSASARCSTAAGSPERPGSGPSRWRSASAAFAVSY